MVTFEKINEEEVRVYYRLGSAKVVAIYYMTYQDPFSKNVHTTPYAHIVGIDYDQNGVYEEIYELNKQFKLIRTK